jgi:hypothetical protein
VLGREFEPVEMGALRFVLEAAEQHIDRRLGRGWLGGAVTNERHDADGPLIYLKQRPITAVTAITLRTYLSTAVETPTLTSGYEVDAERGLVILAGGYRWPAYDYVLVSYTVPATVPADIAHATTLLAAHWLPLAAQGESGAIESFTVDGLSVRYRDAATAAGVPAVPDAVEHILAGHAGLVFA